MNLKTIVVDDLFRAAYLLRFGHYKQTRVRDGKRCFLIEGDAQILNEETVRFRTGFARVDPLVFKESLCLLRELVNQDHFDIDLPADEVELEELTEPMVIDFEEEDES